MNRLYTLILIGLLALGGAAHGQTKVGTIGGSYLLFPTDLRTTAMGSVGASLVNPQSFSSNPGTLGLAAGQPIICLSPMLWGKDFDGFGENYYCMSGSMPLYRATWPGGQRLSVGLAAYSTIMTLPELRETTYYPIGSIIRHKTTNQSHHLLLGVGVEGKLQLGVGLGLAYVRTNSWYDYGVEQRSFLREDWAAEFGTIVRWPLDLSPSTGPRGRIVLTPSAGAAFRNFGPPMSFSINDYPLPQTVTAGIGLEFAVNSRFGQTNWRLLSAAIGNEVQRVWSSGGYSKVGAELSVAEAVALRIGYYDDIEPVRTWGFALGTAGFVKLLKSIESGPGRQSSGSFLTRLNIEYAESHSKPKRSDTGQTFRGFVLTYRYAE